MTASFARAKSYLQYAAASHWTAILTGIFSSILYVLLLLVFILFADLLINKGKIPSFVEQSPNRQGTFLKEWASLPEESRQEGIRHLGIDDGSKKDSSENSNRGRYFQILVSGEDLPPIVGMSQPKEWEDWARKRGYSENLPILATQENEIRWRAFVWLYLKDHVGENAANQFQPEIEADPTAARIISLLNESRGFGILGSVIAQRETFGGSVLNFFASWNAWTWTGSETRDPNLYYLTGLLILAAAIIIIRSIFIIFLNRSAANAALEASTRLRRAVYHHTARLGNLTVRSNANNESQELFEKHIENIHEALYFYLAAIYRYPVQFVLCLMLAILAHPMLALTFMVFGGLIWIVGGQLTAAFRRQSRTASKLLTSRSAVLIESLTMMRLVKGYLMELFNQSRIERQLQEYSEANEKRIRGDQLARPLFVLLALLGTIALLYLAGRLIITESTNVSNLLILVVAAVSLYGPITARFRYRKYLKAGAESAEEVFQFLDRKGDLTQVADAEFLQPMRKQIELIDVSVREPGTTHMLLRNVNLTIPAKSKIGIIGTDHNELLAFVSLIPRFFDPSAGEIKIDGRELKWVTNDSLRAQIGMILQEQLVFNDSVKNNIGCGEPAYTLPQIVEAAKLAHAHQFILKLPNGYETQIGSQGYELTIEEQFRIALARAILRDPAILIIEEPRNLLDEESKSLIDDTLNRFLGDRTVIFIPNRISTLRHLDQVIFLHEGRIEDTGPHKEMLKRNERYQHLYFIRFNVFAE